MAVYRCRAPDHEFRPLYAALTRPVILNGQRWNSDHRDKRGFPLTPPETSALRNRETGLISIQVSIAEYGGRTPTCNTRCHLSRRRPYHAVYEDIRCGQTDRARAARRNRNRKDAGFCGLGARPSATQHPGLELAGQGRGFLAGNP